MEPKSGGFKLRPGGKGHNDSADFPCAFVGVMHEDTHTQIYNTHMQMLLDCLIVVL